MSAPSSKRKDRIVNEPPKSGDSPWRSYATRAVALAVVVLDFAETRYRLGLDETVLALGGLVAVLSLNDGQLPTLRLRLVPLQGWTYWCRVALWLAIALGLLLLICAGACVLLGKSVPIYASPPQLRVFFLMCVTAPVFEEIIYRALLTVAVVKLLGEWGTILLSGLLFGLLHFVRGNASPENQLGGFLLAWAFLRSGTVLVPMAMHSAGNFLAMAGQVVAWYWRLFAI
jgi:uncharacterized protein